MDLRFWGAVMKDSGYIREVRPASFREGAELVLFAGWTEELKALYDVQPVAVAVDEAANEMLSRPLSTADARQDQAMRIMGEARKQLEQLGMQVSLIARSPSGARWPVLLLAAGETQLDIDAALAGRA